MYLPLFGCNTTGGAVLLTPKKPTEEFEGYAEVPGGNYDMYRAQGVLNLPVSDSVRLRLGVDHQRRDGYLNNISDQGPRDFADVDDTTFRASLVVDITEDLENYTIVKALTSENNGQPGQIIACNPAGSFGSLCVADLTAREAAGDDGFYDIASSNPDPISEQDSWQVINTTTWRINENLTLKNIFSYARLETLYNVSDQPTPP